MIQPCRVAVRFRPQIQYGGFQTGLLDGEVPSMNASQAADRTPGSAGDGPDGHHDHTFSPHLRMRSRSDFDRALREGLRLGDHRMTLWAVPNDLGTVRFGLIVGRKHGNAVRRNRIKRVLRSAFRLSQHDLPTGLDLVCSPRTGG